ncbi:MAG: hypothetical protein IJS45_09955 [Clostridia bacterium]|nr:hypothetical protein [Clostridia bacterium]
MNKRILIRILCFVMIASTVLSLAACGGDNSDDDTIKFDPVESVTDDKDDKEAANKFKIGKTDAAGYFKHEPVDGDYAVYGGGYTVDHEVFDTLFNLVLYHQVTPGDGYFDEYDEYFSSGALERDGSIKKQKTPKGIYWYADTRSSALFVCFEAIRCLAFADQNGFYPFSPENIAKIKEERRKIIDGDYGFFAGDLFASAEDDEILVAALSLFVVYADQSQYEEIKAFMGFDVDGFSVDTTLSPNVSSTFAN